MSDRAVGVIPARMESVRFPGKVLAPIAGKPLLQWVVERVRQARALDGVLVATDNRMVLALCEDLDVRGVITRADHPSGTDRVAEAVAAAESGADFVVNIQGDEPLIDPALIDGLVHRLREDPACDMVTAATPVRSQAERDDPSVVKVVLAGNGTRALLLARLHSALPGPAGRGWPASAPSRDLRLPAGVSRAFRGHPARAAGAGRTA